MKVLFPWDRLGKPDDSSSLWIRRASFPSAASCSRLAWVGGHVNFTDGDPDEPFVFGRMYNIVARWRMLADINHL